MQEQAQVKKGFDYKTHIVDNKTGRVIKENHYSLRLNKAGETRIERPIGSGFFYAADGSLIAKPAEKVAAKVESKPQQVAQAVAKANQAEASEKA